MASCFVNNFLGLNFLKNRSNQFDQKETSQKSENDSACLICGKDAGKHVHYGGRVANLRSNYMVKGRKKQSILRKITGGPRYPRSFYL
jgi:hypothetical protein